MGFMDKAKEMAAKADQAISQLDGPNPNKDAGPLYRDLGALTFVREQGRGTEQTDTSIDQVLGRLRELEEQSGMPLNAGSSMTAPPPPGGGVAPPPPPGAAGAAPPAAQSVTAVPPPPPPGSW